MFGDTISTFKNLNAAEGVALGYTYEQIEEWCVVIKVINGIDLFKICKVDDLAEAIIMGWRSVDQ